jgi:hypothetical protein
MLPDDIFTKLEAESRGSDDALYNIDVFRDAGKWRSQLSWSGEYGEFAEGTGDSIMSALEGALDDIEQQRNGGK